MRLIAAMGAAFAIGSVAAPTQAEAVAFPITLEFNYCWGVQTCAYPPGPVFFTVERNGTFTVSDGFQGTWTYNGAQKRIALAYDGGAPIYKGRVLQGCVTNGFMDMGGVPEGSWSGCVI